MTKDDALHHLRMRNQELLQLHREYRQFKTLDWLARFSQRSALFAVRAHKLIGVDLPVPNIILCHDTFALQAAQAMKREHPRAVGWFDNVEFPDPSERYALVPPGVPQIDSPSALALTAHHTAAINQADWILSTSAGQTSALRSMGVTASITTVPNYAGQGILTSRDLRTEMGLGRNDKVAIYIHTAYPGAGLAECLTALRHLPAHIHIALLGRDGLDPSSISIAADLGVADRFQVLTKIDPVELSSFASQADAVLLPLFPESENLRTCMPNRLFEGVLAQRPLVAHANTAIGVFVKENKLGEVFFGGLDLAGAIERAINSPGNDEVFRTAVRRHNWDVAAEPLVSRLSSKDSGHLVVLANKDIANNTRISRLAASVRTAGWQTSVVCNKPPRKSLAVPGVAYFTVG